MVNVLKSVFILIPDPIIITFREKEVNVSTFHSLHSHICFKQMLKIYSKTNSTLIPETNAYEVVGVRHKYQEKS